VTPIRIASDWHLGPSSPPVHGRLARAFLARALRDGARVILNGDVFDDLFEGKARAAAAHLPVAEAMAALRGAGRLERTAGNHDPDAGGDRVELEGVRGVGRVLVSHGHSIDPVNASAIGRLGDAISRRFGRTALVRGSARLAERTARAVAGERMIEIFRGRCEALVLRGGFDLGVFGHVHAPHLAPGDRYANSGSLGDEALEYLELGPEGPRLAALRPGDLEPGEAEPPFRAGGRSG
jgi:UDP-2,3-diacylglucosamine pyrophosphatase LpxH